MREGEGLGGNERGIGGGSGIEGGSGEGGREGGRERSNIHLI